MRQSALCGRLLDVACFLVVLTWTAAVCPPLTTSVSPVADLAEHMGLAKLNERFKDPGMQAFFGGLFPRDDPRNTRFAINFFTAIGLGVLT